MKITIAGLGYIGLVHAVCFAEVGHEVTCIDENQEKVELLQRGELFFYEPKVFDLMKKNSSRLHFTYEKQAAYTSADLIIITVPADIKEDGSSSLHNVYKIITEAAEYLEKDCFIIVKTTVPIGTNDNAERVMRECLANDVQIEFVSNPDFLRLGNAVDDLLNASRIVIGAESEAAERVMREVYEGFHLPFVVINRRSAEMLTYAANGMLSVQIGFMHELANVCEAVGANIEDVTRGMHWEDRIAKQFVQTCLGYGEIPYKKESKSLNYFSKLYEVDVRTLRASIETSEVQKWRLLNKGRKYYSSYADITVAMLGVSCKSGTDDIDCAPALSYVKVLLEEGANVKVWDLAAINHFKKIYANEVTYCQTIEETLSGADICFIFTKWPDIKYFDVYEFSQHMKCPIVIDAVNCYSLCDIEEAGVVYESIGRKMIDSR